MMENTKDAIRRTNYIESLIHFLKAGIGSGVFALGNAFMNGGIVVTTILLILMAIICAHCQHQLSMCSKRIKTINNFQELPDYADTVWQCFLHGPQRFQKWANFFKILVNVCLCMTQLGFCSTYFMFISSNLTQILRFYGIYINVHVFMLIIFVPILIGSLITNLKALTPVSLCANFCLVFCLTATMYFALRDGLHGFKDRDMYTSVSTIPLAFGTIMFAYASIAIVLPLQNEMLHPEQLVSHYGIINIGLAILLVIYYAVGFFGYMKWGHEVGGSLTLNIGYSPVAQAVKIIAALSVLFGYPIQFYSPIRVLWPMAQRKFQIKRHLLGELVVRTLGVVFTLAVAEFLPHLDLFTSLIGALCATMLSLLFPPIIETISKDNISRRDLIYIVIKNAIIIFLGVFGLVSGTYESIKSLIVAFDEE